MKTPNNVSFALFNLDQTAPLKIEDDGHIGTVDSMKLVEEKPLRVKGDDELTLRRWESLLLEITVAKNAHAWVFNVNEEGDVTPSRDWHAKPLDEDDPSHDAPEGTKVHRRYIPIAEAEIYGVPTTKYPNNNLRILEMLDDGYFQLWGVAVVSQRGEFFLTIEKMYSPFRCYRSGKTVVSPTHHANEKNPGWVPFITLLNRVLKGNLLETLPSIEEIDNEKPQPKQQKNSISEGEGRVVWFSQMRQYGMLLAKEGDRTVQVMAHWQHINRDGSRRRFLQDGEKVKFEKLTKKHSTTKRASGFTMQAEGITPVTEETE
jgi:cold shock CspA family protein